jgi:hypothetical protein
VTLSTSANKRGGAILIVCRLMKRSITSATASTEQASSGHIGHPAACMMENNKTPGSMKCA